jgi:hypothetical protein
MHTDWEAKAGGTTERVAGAGGTTKRGAGAGGTTNRGAGAGGTTKRGAGRPAARVLRAFFSGGGWGCVFPRPRFGVVG